MPVTPIDLTPRTFGKSEVVVPRIGLGGAPLGDVMGSITPLSAAQILARVCVGDGPSLVDTAPFYGAGLSESRVGAALPFLNRSEVVLSTKVGRLIVQDSSGAATAIMDHSHDAAMRSFEASLQRLGVDSVDIVHIHDPDDDFETALRGSLRALEDLKAAGAIRAISVGMNQWQMLSRFIDYAAIDGVLLAGRYTLLDASAAETFLPKCQAHGIGVIVGGVFNSGILTDPDVNRSFDYEVAPEVMIARARRLQAVCTRHDVPLRAAALQFALRHRAVTGIVVGVKSAAEWDDNIAMARVALTDALWTELEAVNLTNRGGRGISDQLLR